MRSASRIVDRRRAMTSDDERGAALQHVLERGLHVCLVLVVEVARGLVEDHDRRAYVAVCGGLTGTPCQGEGREFECRHPLPNLTQMMC